MNMNFAWFVEKSGAPNENWKFYNSLHDLRERLSTYSPGDSPVYLEFGPVHIPGQAPNSIASLPLSACRTLPDVFPFFEGWLNRMFGGPLYVYGKRNLFEPLVHHYNQQRQAQVSLSSAYDLLETLVLPGSVPTIEDRTTCDRIMAAWLTGQPMLTPYEFWKHLNHHGTF